MTFQFIQMFAKRCTLLLLITFNCISNIRLQSVQRFSLSYAVFHNVHNCFGRAYIKSTPLIEDQYQALKRNCVVLLPTKASLSNNFYTTTSRFSSQLTTCIINMLNYLPFFASGNIVSGFGRGSKELGIPTANYPLEVVKSLPDCFKTGVYFGWANVDNGPVYKMVMSIGWNPFYENKEKSMETHILHGFNKDLYGCLLKICIVGYLRPERNFDSLEGLIACIKDDIRQAEDLLETNEDYKKLHSHTYFAENSDSSTSNKNNTIQ